MHINMVNWSLTTSKDDKENGAKLVSSINGSGTTGHPYAKNEYRHRPFIPHKN